MLFINIFSLGLTHKNILWRKGLEILKMGRKIKKGEMKLRSKAETVDRGRKQT